jgi:hypothetical protein
MYYLLTFLTDYFFGESGMPDHHPPRGDAGIFAVFELFALALVSGGIGKGLDGQNITALISCVIALFLMFIGLKWTWIGVKISETWQPAVSPKFLIAFLVIGLSGMAWFGIFHSSPQPDFKLEIMGANVFVPPKEQGLTGLALEVRIWNIGDRASIATNWKLMV